MPAPVHATRLGHARREGGLRASSWNVGYCRCRTGAASVSSSHRPLLDMTRHTLALAVLACLLALGAGAGAAAEQAAARPASTAPVTLRILFPEGFTVRRMADRVSEVRRIAIRKRGVTPRLTGVAY